MKRMHWAVGVAVLIVTVALSSGVCAETESGAGTAKGFWVEEANLELESVPAGSDAVGTFVFHNDTGKEVKILKAKPS